VRARVAIGAGCVLLGLCGCGSRASTPAPRTPAPTPTVAAAQNAPRSLVREYVAALNERNTVQFCRLLAPWVQARVGAAIKEGFASGSEAQTPETKLCPQGARFIGYAGDTASREWVRADIVSLSAPRAAGDLVVFDMTVRDRFKRTSVANPSGSVPLDTVQRDRVYVVQIAGEWRIAKLSAVADAATIGLVDRTPALAPPDLARERAWYRRRLATDARYAHQARDTAAGGYTDCSTVAPVKAVGDGAGDLTSNIAVTASGRVRVPARPGADLRRVAVARSAGTLCADFEAAGAITAPVVMTIILRQPGHGDSGALLKIDAVVQGARNRVVSLSYPGVDESPGKGAVDGRIGTSGSRLSLVLTRDQVPPFLRRLFDHFDWEAASLYVPTPRGSGPHPEFTDAVPDAGPNIPYP
jgi:hypothetical protein